MITFDDFTAAILNGGDGRRIGGVNKAMIEIDGETIVSRTLKVLTPIFKTIILAGNRVTETQMKYLEPVTDRFPGAGPLAGIDAALAHTCTRYLFVFAGDMPWLSAELISEQIDFMRKNPCDIVIPRLKGEIEPLHSIIDRRVIPDLEKYLETNNNSSVRAFFQSTDVRYFDVTDKKLNKRSFGNINSHEDLCP